jgi:hypothetical protein
MEGRELWGPAGFAGFVHDHIARTIGQLDTKVSIIMGFAAAAIAYDIQQLKSLATATALIDPSYFSHLAAGTVAPDWKSLFGSVSAICLAAAFLCATECLRPRSGPTSKSVVFFRGIAAHRNASDYAAEAAHTPESDLIDAVLVDAYALSRIARRKAFWASWTTYAFISGLFFLIVTQVLATLIPNTTT